jgi:3-hydroxy-9,10-secoandrosta-1,3,5(10)-triene-9,17-dione monooxygenase reductase component
VSVTARMDGLDQRDLRNAFGAFATGVTIITSRFGDVDVGLTANSFSSVSLDPPLILWSLDRRSGSLEAFERTSGFAVHVLSVDQEDLSNRFARKASDKFDGLELERGADGIPLLSGCAARFECRTAYAYDGGDHVIFVGEVQRYLHSETAPLVFHRGTYKRASYPASGTSELPPLATSLSLANRACRADAIKLARSVGITWPDVTILGHLLGAGPASPETINEQLALSGLLFDQGAQARLEAANLVDRQGETFTATESGRRLAADIVAAVRAVELEISQRHPAEFDAICYSLGGLLASFGNSGEAAEVVLRLHETGRGLSAD